MSGIFLPLFLGKKRKVGRLNNATSKEYTRNAVKRQALFFIFRFAAIPS